MQDDVSIQGALNAVGLSGASLSAPIGGVVSPVHRAVENHCFLAVKAGQPLAFVKRRHDDMSKFIALDGVADASRKAGELGISPRLLHVDPANGVLVFEALGEEWSWGHTDVLRRPRVLENLLTAKRTFQRAAPLAETRSVFDLTAVYRQLADGPDVILPEPVFTVSAAVQRIAGAIGASGVDTVPCHADGISSNVMVGPDDRVLLVDFEWARQADPAYDLGTVLAELLPFDGEALLAIEIATGKPDAAVLARARLYGAADDLMWALWGFINAARSPRKHVEFFKYAEWRLLRARTIIEGPRFETWLKQV
ncbi:phosphotransferase [Rhizobium rhizogenes]|uniref:phosphotransferase n=1 Tax=Rhizobium rhizogenes TaxID=359 RepID=UPI0022B6B3A9|nr:phosphotransferase [Rhizobium rhizogenes]MCZ7448234.1 phosphotransferase [Rhizobium rhizogenes]MCZ7465895.1 phosphotransferase [Rhizobium rhizogenes]